jgi:hypothetical protein
MKIIKPIAGHTFIISAAPEWPDIIFETDAKGEHTWNWTISWDRFKKEGQVKTNENKWNAKSVVTNYGGTLRVTVRSGKEPAQTTTVKIVGTNPTAYEAKNYLTSRLREKGLDKTVIALDKIIEHETHCENFRPSRMPIKAFDNGYGMCQLTTPAPNYEQVWNWKLNIDEGIKFYLEKRKLAVAYLAQQGRTYTDEQLLYEIVTRYNGGSYHVWDANAKAWARPSSILCDPQAGNMGWNMNDKDNAGKTLAELHKRDFQSFSKPREAGANWIYSGRCYADKILKVKSK